MPFQFKKGKKVVIGALHLGPLLGFPNHSTDKQIEKNALVDLHAFENGGVDAVIYENNYDLPHTEFLEAPQIVGMTYFGQHIKNAATVPLGVSVLWNDYPTALSLATTLQLPFVRIPVFVDTVKTAYGKIAGDPKKVQDIIKTFKAQNVSLFTDIHVKHAKLLSKYSLVESARRAIKFGSSAIIITGKWTGDAPDMVELKQLRSKIGSFPILLGSGVNADNVKDLFKYADGAIVSTALKADNGTMHAVNVKSYESRISSQKVKKFMQSF